MRRLLSVAEAAEGRRSIRVYRPDPIPRRDLGEILRLAGLAPSAFNLQPWRFLVVEDPATRQRLQDAAYGQRQVGWAPAVIVLYSDMADSLAQVEEIVHPGVTGANRDETIDAIRRAFAAQSDEQREVWGAGQSYIALGYLLLAAWSLGYGTSPMLGFDAAEVKRILDLPSRVQIPALVAIGLPAEEGYPHHRRAPESIVRFI